jgi:hypothetical protein
MPQVFHPSANTLSRVVLSSLVIGPAALLGLIYLLVRSPYQTQVGVIREQPVQFSHEHHVNGLGIDCRFCHTSVETAASAGMPATHTCMTCHSQIWSDSPLLEPVRVSMKTKEPLAWARLHDLPDFVYFHHGIHIQKGVGCAECHGRIDKMPLAWRDKPLTMEWCLECHRDPAPRLRPTRDDVFAMDWEPPAGSVLAQRGEILEKNHVEVGQLTNCSICHR